MKQFLLLSLVFLCLISCSSNESSDPNGTDGNDPQTQDPIIGTWTLQKNNGFDVSECVARSTYVFETDNSFTFEEYKLDNNQCTLSNSYNGEWTNNDDGTYHIRRHGYTSGANGPITFENNNQNMIITQFTWLRK